MTGYRRNFVPGGSFFFTVNLAQRRLRLLTDHMDRNHRMVKLGVYPADWSGDAAAADSEFGER